MIASKRDKAKRPSVRDKKTGTRDAVETAIDMAKEDGTKDWESRIAKRPKRITPWESHESATADR